MNGNMCRLLTVAFLSGPVLLLNQAVGAENDAAGATTELVAREKFIKSQFVSLKTKILELADLLEASEPDSARILRQTVSHAQKAFITENMDHVAKLLAEGLASVAAATKSNVVEDIRKVLQTLQFGQIDIDKRLERIKKWKKLLESIKDMLKREKNLEQESRLSRDKDNVTKQMNDLSRRMAGIVAEQKTLLKDTQALDDRDKNPQAKKLTKLRDKVRELIAHQDKVTESVDRTPVAKLALPAALQKAIADETDTVKKQADTDSADAPLIKAIANAGGDPQTLAKVSKHLDQAAGEMRKAKQALLQSSISGARDPQIQAKADLKAAEEALTDALRRMASATPAGKLSDKQSDLSEKTKQLAQDIQAAADKTGVESKAGNLSRASSQMSKASDKLTGQNAKAGAEHQKKALAELEKKKDELAKLTRRILKKIEKPTDKQAKDQKDLARNAESTSRKMKADQPAPTPGQASMQKASEAMSKAGEKLSRGQSGQANLDQQEAIKQLSRAQDELAEQLEREEELAQTETLTKIDQMLGKMLSAQRTLTAGTSKVFTLRKDDRYDRSQQLALAGLADGEGKLAADADKILKMLAKEGSTVVFPAILTEVKGDLQQAQALLAERDAGALTQDVQRGIERNLQEMIDALRKELARRRKKKGGGGGDGGGGGKCPLVPPVAELKMLKSLELLIKGRTTLLARWKSEGKEPAAKLAREHKRLAGQQDKVRNIAESVAKKMQQNRRQER